MIESITTFDLEYLKNPNIIDIRSIEKYNNNHIPNSINIPLEKLLSNFDKYLDKNKKYYIYCQKGIQSKKVCQILKNSGYDIINIIGGYETWILNK